MPGHLRLLLGLPCYFGGIVESMLSRILTISLVVSVVLLGILLQTTAPTKAGPLGILIVFILMYVSVLSALTFLIYGVSRIVSKVATSFTTKHPKALTFTRSYYFSSVIALAPVIFVGMQSVGKVGVYDVLLVALFVVISCIYIAKRTA